MQHVPVLLNEVLRYLDPKPGEVIVDGTLDGCGYARAIIKQLGNSGTFIGLDWDAYMTELARERLAPLRGPGIRIEIVCDAFANVRAVLDRLGISRVNKLVLDLGFSTEQIEHSGRGFSFADEHRDEPLLMTYRSDATPLRDILATIDLATLTSVLHELGEERYADRIARAIVEREQQGRIEKAGELVDVIVAAVPWRYRHSRLHPATRTFLALRLYANGELTQLTELLRVLPEVVAPSGCVVIVSFHSLEDRIVKQHFARYEQQGIATRLTKKPVTASPLELAANPRARSAKLRALAMLDIRI